MRLSDQLSLCGRALLAHRLRAGLSMLGIAIGVAAVILLTAIGEGARIYVVEQLQQFGTNVLQINPGKTETIGLPGVMGGTTHKLTIEDAQALHRVQGVECVVPVVFGQARVAAEGRGRSVYIFGVTAEAQELWKVQPMHGSFLPDGDPRRAHPVVVLGPGLKRELFGDRNAVGAWVRVSGWRLRVLGVMEPKGRILGFDMDDTAYVPVGTAMGMFDVGEMNEINVAYGQERMADAVVESIREILKERHGGSEDFTILTQADMLEIFDDIMGVITAGVAAIAAVSLLVGAIGILTVMWIAVGERTSEIGLYRALGASVGQVRSLFLWESGALAVVGGLVGLGSGLACSYLLAMVLPGLPVNAPPRFIVAALITSVATGLISGIAPARRAANLDPIEALRDE